MSKTLRKGHDGKRIRENELRLQAALASMDVDEVVSRDFEATPGEPWEYADDFSLFAIEEA